MTNKVPNTHFNYDISIIITILNGEKWIDDCFHSIIVQTALKQGLQIEVSVFNDASTDATAALLDLWKQVFKKEGLSLTVSNNSTPIPKGVGYGRNVAVKESSGEFLCFQDVDDIMLPDRLQKQYLMARDNKNAIVGSKFTRVPENSTERYTKWANSLSPKELNIQIYTSHGPTVIMPTWFFHRDVFERVGGFSEDGKGTPEDLIYFYKHIDGGGNILRVDEILLVYTYHLEATTFSISSEIIWDIRMNHFIKKFLPKCTKGFTIWNGGKQGRKFIKSLNTEQRDMVLALCDVDTNKIGTFYELYSPTLRKVIKKIPIIHFSEAKPPLVICMKLDLTEGEFEKNLLSMNLKEGKDYIIFS